MATIKKLFFDCETTGLNPKRNDIIEMAGIIEVDGTARDNFTIQCEPWSYDNVNQKALDINGYNIEKLRTFSKPQDAYKKLVGMLGRYVDKFNKADKYYFIGFNARNFDAAFLRFFFEKAGDRYFGSWFFMPPIDIDVIAAERLLHVRPHMPDFKLATVAKELGISVDTEQCHGAAYDTMLVRKIHDAIKFGSMHHEKA